MEEQNDQELVVSTNEQLAQSWTGMVYKGTWRGNYVGVRVISMTDVRENFEMVYAKYVSPSFAHENVLRVLSHSMSLDGIHRYFVLEPFTLTLRQHCELQPRDVTKDVDALRQMTEGLLYIHAKGLIHGSLNPDNIFVCHHHPNLLFKLSDFGLHQSTTAVENRILFRHLHPMYWVVPSQTKERLNPYGPHMGPNILDITESFHNDVFALGCTLFFYLIGCHPFLGANEQVLINMERGNSASLHMLEGHVAYQFIRDMIEILPA